ncbi:hypothetical protein Aph02nite_53010 [Actinoplanes philippinensis]|nr:hypothetical protein Aph02nite_53010 [Actinoplanes philippinensis]
MRRQAEPAKWARFRTPGEQITGLFQPYRSKLPEGNAKPGPRVQFNPIRD